MIHLKVDRSRVRLVLMLLAGVVLVIAAVDIVRHCDDADTAWQCNFELAGPPETDDNGALTSRGSAQRRQDVLWSSLFLVTGGGAIVLSAIGLQRRLPLVELTDDGIRVRALGTRRYMDIPWHMVVRIQGGRDDSGNYMAEPALAVQVEDSRAFPQHLWGAEWHGDELLIDAGSWSTPVEEVVIHANLLLQRHGRLVPAAADEATGADGAPA